MICRSLERVADHATNIAEDVIFWVQGADVRHYKKRQRRQAGAEDCHRASRPRRHNGWLRILRKSR